MTGNGHRDGIASRSSASPTLDMFFGTLPSVEVIIVHLSYAVPFEIPHSRMVTTRVAKSVPAWYDNYRSGSEQVKPTWINLVFSSNIDINSCAQAGGRGGWQNDITSSLLITQKRIRNLFST